MTLEVLKYRWHITLISDFKNHCILAFLDWSHPETTDLHSSSTFPPSGLTPWTPAVFRFSRDVGFNFGIVC